MERRRSLVAALTRSMHVPVVLIAAAVASVLLLRLLTDIVTNAPILGSTAVVAAICVPLFIVALADTNTRSAIERTRERMARQWPSMTWRRRMFFPEEADRLLLFLNRLLWIEAVVAIVVFFDETSFMLAFAGFALTTIFISLELGNPHSRARQASD